MPENTQPEIAQSPGDFNHQDTKTPSFAGSKDWWKSQTLWGAILAVLPTLLHLFGVEIHDKASFSQDVMDIVTLTGSMLAIAGRFKANTTLTRPSLGVGLWIMGAVLCLGLGGCTSLPIPWKAQVSASYHGAVLTTSYDGKSITTDLSADLDSLGGYRK